MEYGYCYCALYVRKDVFEGKTPIVPIPERRPLEKQAAFFEPGAPPQKASEMPPAGEKDRRGREATTGALGGKHLPEKRLWYCRQCGYVCFREDPPYVCPICKAKRELFSEVTLEARG